MSEFKWSASEKKIARTVYDEALRAELAEVMAEFKRRAAALEKPADMWAVGEYLDHKGREINRKYDYRYSQLIWIFGLLLREGRIQEAQLTGLAEEKLSSIRLIASL